MTINETIDKAIKGGYGNKVNLTVTQYNLFKDRNLHWQIFLYDPKFWQALGKTLGWNIKGKHKWSGGKKGDWYYEQYGPKAKRCIHCTTDNFTRRIVVEGHEKDCYANSPTIHWHKFIDHLANGKTPKDFFKDLK